MPLEDDSLTRAKILLEEQPVGDVHLHTAVTWLFKVASFLLVRFIIKNQA